VVSVLLGLPAEQSGSLVIDDEERAALATLAESGLVPPLRLVHAVNSLAPEDAGGDRDAADAV
jgi:hypothetical protein